MEISKIRFFIRVIVSMGAVGAIVLMGFESVGARIHPFWLILSQIP